MSAITREQKIEWLKSFDISSEGNERMRSAIVADYEQPSWTEEEWIAWLDKTYREVGSSGISAALRSKVSMAAFLTSADAFLALAAANSGRIFSRACAKPSVGGTDNFL